MQPAPEPLLPPHGGYRRLKICQVARLVYDVTLRFCDSFIPGDSMLICRPSAFASGLVPAVATQSV